MTGGEAMEYWIEDPRPIAARAPYTFFLPSAEELGALEEGDLVKLLFEYGIEVEKWGAERMWVTVTAIEGDEVVGALANVPDEPRSPLSLGDSIRFLRQHALAVLWAEGKDGPKPPEYREYWDRCMVDDCVIEDGVPVEYLYREQPDMGKPGDRYPDSGWRIRGRQGDTSDADMDARTASYVALGLVLNKDDSWLELINAPVGAAFMRNSASGEYEAVEPA